MWNFCLIYDVTNMGDMLRHISFFVIRKPPDSLGGSVKLLAMSKQKNIKSSDNKRLDIIPLFRWS